MVYVAADVEAVRCLWSRSGALAGADVRAQLEAYADALIAALAARELGAEVLISEMIWNGSHAPLTGEWPDSAPRCAPWRGN
jgi:hypothetical protein